MIYRVFPWNISQNWQQFADVLAPAIAMTPTHNAEDVRLACMSGRADMWAQWEEPIVESAAVTEFISYPRGLWLRIWLGACRPDRKQDSAGFLREFKQWARVNGCLGIEIAGRMGWARRFPEFKIEGVGMRMFLEDQ